ncbi:ADP-ribosylglycohydrolase family protein [Flaviaesturariibacter amylovorans]|uniref:ADP-ribosylglycohydrolase family protein n=1 Tax=Flaviaesturariibacter amylovorans TaxID=1084520 RepID=A0ABP8G424_9BACT
MYTSYFINTHTHTLIFMVRDALIGLAVGDALGVPVEFTSRAMLDADPVVDMRGYGSHWQAPGTWSDDSALTFCLAEVLVGGYDLKALADSFTRWLYQGHWTANGDVFDVGIATRQAIDRLKQGCEPTRAGGAQEPDNGNGSLMRILPLVFFIRTLPMEQRFTRTREVSSLTHRHIRSVIACFYYLEFARLLLEGKPREAAYQELKDTIAGFLRAQDIPANEIVLFGRLLEGDIATLPREQIQSSGYVLHTLEASIWCLMTASTYSEAVLNAVNLGADTDTTGAVTGGSAGMVFGQEQIPKAWLSELKRLADIERLADDLARSTAHM